MGESQPQHPAPLAHSDTLAHAAAKAIAAAAPGFAPRLAVICGSGLSGLAATVKRVAVIEYTAIPGFHAATAPSHVGRLVLGHLGGGKTNGTGPGVPVAIMQGRFHLYEGHDAAVWRAPVRALKLLGCDTLFATNAVGGCREDFAPPCLVALTDHINGFPGNPLAGANDDAFGVRFPDMSAVYDPVLRAALHGAATELSIPLRDGVYFGMLGPCFETPAEVRAIRTLGGDVVGMSLVPEAIVARHCGMRIAAVSVVTNFAAGLNAQPLTAEEVIAGSGAAAHDLTCLLEAWATRVFAA